ncbi:MAG: hypothetical protein AMXMBFR33_28440 [Candidatus Xenobia bacterium]
MSQAQRVGRFRILSQEGAGGMGIILLGQDETLGRKAAIKLLSPERLNDPKAVIRFQREAQAAARLKHPNIAALYEMGEHDSRPYLAIEWVEGQSLENILRQGPLALERAVLILEQVLAALDYAHAQGVIHRDIKPANLMLSAGDRVTLVDFGLAFLLSEPGITSTGVLFGTPLYLAPEMAGEEDVDGRADLYSAALVFFEMLTGAPPFPAATPAELISQHLHAPRPVLSERKPELPTRLDPVLLKAMAREPSDRYPTGQAFLRAVKSALGALQPAAATRPNWPSVVAAGLALLATGLWVLAPRSLPLASPLPPRPRPAAPEDWAQPGGDASRSFTLSQELAQPRQRWKADATGAQSLLVHQGTLLVGLADRVEALEADSGKTLWSHPGGDLQAVAWTEPPLAIVQQGSTIRALKLPDGQEAWKAELGAPGPGAVLADDGCLYAGSGSSLACIQASDGDRLWTLELGQPVRLAPVARNAGAFVALENQVVAVDSFSEKVVWRWKAPSSPSALTLTPEDTVLVGCQDGQLVSLPMLSGEPYFEDQLDSTVVSLAATAGVAAVACKEGQLALYPMPSGERPIWQVDLEGEPMGVLTDGQQVLVTTRQGEIQSLKGGIIGWKVSLAGVCSLAPVAAGTWLYTVAGNQLQAFAP